MKRVRRLAGREAKGGKTRKESILGKTMIGALKVEFRVSNVSFLLASFQQKARQTFILMKCILLIAHSYQFCVPTP